MSRGGPRAVAAIVTLSLVSLTGCSSSADEFCTMLTKHYKLQALIKAVNDRDDAAVRENFAELRKLEDSAPKELFADVHAVLDVMEDVIRTLVPAPASNGDRAPVDRAALNLRLEAIQKSAQHITDYADRNCGIKL